MKIKLNCDLLGFKKDQIISIDADKEGTPMNKFWRKRLRDSEIDKCIEIVKDKKSGGKK